ncbi:hypothetical protein LEMLEM_LOCUS25576 [Lemmus lemmus]
MGQPCTIHAFTSIVNEHLSRKIRRHFIIRAPTTTLLWLCCWYLTPLLTSTAGMTKAAHP